ncbi:MAG: HAD family phosphatase [Pseudomonadota bacterium]
MQHQIQYVFWDCDNTLVHTAEHHWLKNLHVLRRYGIELPEEYKHRIFLQGSPQNYEWFKEELGFKCDKETYLREVDEWFTENAHQIKIRDGVIDALEYFKKNNMPQAVVSNGRTHSVRTVLDAVDLTPYFDAILCKEDYQGRKPDPEPYLAGIRAIESKEGQKINPANCMAIEDEEKGVQSAEAAGMAVFYRPLGDDKPFDILLS